MPIIHRIEKDMFVFADVVDYMTNPVNLMGAPGAGLALEFRRRCPDYVELYRAACRSKELRIGTIQVLENVGQDWGMINLPTKDHYVNPSEKMDIIRGLEALREFLTKDENRYASIGLPMLGCGLGKQDYEVVYPLMIDHLGDLDATVMLSMSPERTEMRPKYLMIVGPPDYQLKEEDKAQIDSVIERVLINWGTTLSDYTGVVSGGCPGVDTYICGADFNKNYEDTLVYRKTGKVPLVVKANHARNGIGANLHQNNLLCEIGDDIILFKPKGYNNNRMSGMQMWLEADKSKRELDGHPPRRVAIYGERDTAAAKPFIIHSPEE